MTLRCGLRVTPCCFIWSTTVLAPSSPSAASLTVWPASVSSCSQLDRLLHGRLLRASRRRQGAAVVDRLAGLEHPRPAPSRLIIPTSGADGARRVSQVASVSTGDPDRPDLRTYQASPGLPVLMLVMTPAPFISDSDVTELRRGPRQPNGNVRGIDRHAETRSQ